MRAFRSKFALRCVAKCSVIGWGSARMGVNPDIALNTANMITAEVKQIAAVTIFCFLLSAVAITLNGIVQQL